MGASSTTASPLPLVCFFLLLGASASALRLPGLERSRHVGAEVNGTKWALLVAGSAGWGNYRHQADICHAYQVLKRGGLEDENIIVMMADDIARHAFNPYPGKLFNKPGGPDVYQGVPKDYTGSEVNAANVLKVLAGDAKAMNGIGSGKVVASGPNDTVFFYFADHGAPGILGMPSGSFLYADSFVDTLIAKSETRGFSKMVAYIEACESGSIFQGFNLTDSRIYATTAANAVESSWGTYCPGMTPSPPPELRTCLGDLYSVAFLEDDDQADRRHETLQEQYEVVKERVSNYGSYQMGSHVLQFGDMSFTSDPVGTYIGFRAEDEAYELAPFARRLLAEDAVAYDQSVPQRDAELVYMTSRYIGETDPDLKQVYFDELVDFVSDRQHIDHSIRKSISLWLQDEASVKELYKVMPGIPGNLNLAVAGLDAIQSELINTPVGRSETKQVVDDWDCLRTAINTWEEACGPLGQYGMKYSRLFANVCNLNVSKSHLRTENLKVACAKDS